MPYSAAEVVLDVASLIGLAQTLPTLALSRLQQALQAVTQPDFLAVLLFHTMGASHVTRPVWRACPHVSLRAFKPVVLGRTAPIQIETFDALTGCQFVEALHTLHPSTYRANFGAAVPKTRTMALKNVSLLATELVQMSRAHPLRR